MKFSIIIPVRAFNAYLKENIEHLKQLKNAEFEVIILPDLHEDFTFNDARFKVIPTGPMGPGEKRNIGAKNSTGDVLAFLDDDAYPSEDWLEKAEEILNKTGTYALGAPAVTPLDAKFKELVSGLILLSPIASGNTIYRHTPKEQKLVDDYPSVNLFIKKDAFDSVGGFASDFWPGEDTKICLDLVNKFHKKFIYDPSPVVYHHRRDIYLPYLKQVSRYGRYRGNFAKIFPQSSRVPSYFVPSLFVLGVLLGFPVSIMFPFLLKIYLSVILFYFTSILFEFVRNSISNRNLFVGLSVGVGIILTHFAYGINFLIGFFKSPTLALRGVDKKTGNYIGG